MKRRALAHALTILALSGCVPLTFSRDEVLDFSMYQKVGVDVRTLDLAAFYGEDRASAYLASELARDSGFAEVTLDLSEEDIDLYLSVDVSLVERVVEDEYGFLDFEYEALARFVAQDTEGAVIDSGTRSDVNGFPAVAVEGVLDEVALRYFKPYRL